MKADKAAAHDVAVTLFDNKWAKKLTTKRMPIWQLRNLILTTSADSKDALPLLKLAEFGDKRSELGSLRTNENTQAINGIEADYDGEKISFDCAVQTIKQARLNAIIYTSPSHTEEKPRWRILCPTSRKLKPQQREKMLARLCAVFGEIFGPESFTLSQAYYYGKLTDRSTHRCEYYSGDFIDLRDDLDETSRGKNGRTYTGELHISGDEPQADAELVAAAVANIPNKELDWHFWSSTMGLAIWRSTGGSDAGLKIFEDFSSRLEVKDKNFRAKDSARKRWGRYRRSPPTRIGFGTLHHLADQAAPGWRAAFEEEQLQRAYTAMRNHTQANKEQNSEAQEDAEPIDLWGKFEPPLLPRKLLPKVIEDYAFTQGETMGADPAGIAMAALAVCAGATPDSIKLQMKKHSDEWQECARIWVGLVGLPSTKKTPIMSAVSKTLMRLDGDRLRKFLFEIQNFKKLSADERKNKQEPVQTRLRLEDTTIEAAQEVLSSSPEGVLLHQDELSGWFGSMDKYGGNRGAAKDRGFWLQSYNGGPSTWNRIGRGVGYIPNLSISLLGGIQPDVIRRLAAESYDDGFLQRMLTILLRDAVMGKDVPTPAIADKYAKLIERLTELSPPKTFGNFVVPLSFDAEAQQLREELEHKHLKLMHFETVNRKLTSHIGKYDGLFGRLCVLWHCIEHAYDKALPPVVEIATAKRVASFIHRFLLRHAIAFYAGVLGLADDHDRLAAVAGYILAHKLERLTTRDIARGDSTMRRLTARDTEQVFEQLEAFGWIDRVSAVGRTVKPGTLHWRVNPLVHTRFAAHAVREIERRATTREMILKEGAQRGGF